MTTSGDYVRPRWCTTGGHFTDDDRGAEVLSSRYPGRRGETWCCLAHLDGAIIVGHVYKPEQRGQVDIHLPTSYGDPRASASSIQKMADPYNDGPTDG